MDNMNISEDRSYNYSNITDDHVYNDTAITEYQRKMNFILLIVTCVIICVGLPLTLVAIYSLRSMVKDGNVAPLYVINLLISDILQFCGMIGMKVADQAAPKQKEIGRIFSDIYIYSVFTSVGFMVCISLERYLVIAWPLWYRFRRTIKISVGVCVLVWILPLVPYLTASFANPSLYRSHFIWAIYLLLPLPLFILFLVGTVKALSASISVPSDEKRRIMGVLVLVLLIYLLLFLPNVIMYLKSEYDEALDYVSFMILELSPLADLFLYIFMKKGAIDKLLSSLCRCRMDSSDSISPSVEMMTP